MADNVGDDFNGTVGGNAQQVEDQLARLYANHDAQVEIIKQLEAQLAEAKQAAMEWANAYIELVNTLGYSKQDILSNKVKHLDVVQRIEELIL